MSRRKSACSFFLWYCQQSYHALWGLIQLGFNILYQFQYTWNIFLCRETHSTCLVFQMSTDWIQFCRAHLCGSMAIFPLSWLYVMLKNWKFSASMFHLLDNQSYMHIVWFLYGSVSNCCTLHKVLFLFCIHDFFFFCFCLHSTFHFDLKPKWTHCWSILTFTTSHNQKNCLWNEAREKKKKERGRIVHACSEVASEHIRSRIPWKVTLQVGTSLSYWKDLSQWETIHGKGILHDLLDNNKNNTKRMRK